MTKLKTLKDFYSCHLECGKDHLIKISDLKQEAIKIINNCKGCRGESFKNKCIPCFRFVWFFNITEEDLKDD